MSTLTFDTLKFANRLKTAGVPAVQAEAEAEALSEVFETNLSELVTNKDMDAKFEKTTSLLRHEMSDMKFELLKWIMGIAIAQTGLIIGILKFFPINS
jgi:hypothetical protein